jgi:hypothetical protein
MSIVKLVTCCHSEACGIELYLLPWKDSYVHWGVKGTAVRGTYWKISLLTNVIRIVKST